MLCCCCPLSTQKHTPHSNTHPLTALLLHTHPSRPQKKKDPNAPKRGLSAYMFFCQDMRETIKTENPDMSFTDLTKELGRQWKELTESDKKPVSVWGGWRGLIGDLS